MTGKDVVILIDDLGLNEAGSCRLLGLAPEQLQALYAYGDKMLDPGAPISPLSFEVLTELWRQTAGLTPHCDHIRVMGIQLAEAMHVHGVGYAVWLVLNTRCKPIFDLNAPKTEPLAARPR